MGGNPWRSSRNAMTVVAMAAAVAEAAVAATQAADSAISQEFGSATTASQIVGQPPIRPYRRSNLVN